MMNFETHVKDIDTSMLRNIARSLRTSAKQTGKDTTADVRAYLKAARDELALRDAAAARAAERARRKDIGGGLVATKLRTVYMEDGCDESETTTYKLTAEHSLRKADLDDIREALHDQYHRRCSHEHDCCGCMFGGPFAVRKVRGHILFKVGYSRNV